MENGGASECGRNRSKQTLNEKYGVDSPGELLREKEYLEKARTTSMDKYGCVWPSSAEIVKNRNEQTCLEKYGCSNYSIYVSYKSMLDDKLSVPVFSLRDLD